MPVEKTCVVCGSLFMVPPVREKTAKVCSVECRSKQNAMLNESKRAKKTCPTCGKEFSVPACHDERRKFCSDECADPHRHNNPPKGSNHYRWSGFSLHSDGYLYLRVDGHHFAGKGNYVFEHRIVMEERMRVEAPDHPFLIEVDGVKYLRPEILVHHIDEVKRNNRANNLLACTAGAHKSIHNGMPPMVGEVWPAIDGMVPFRPYKVECTCETCGGKFLKKRSDVDRGAGKYCSRKCYNRRPKEAFNVVIK